MPTGTDAGNGNHQPSASTLFYFFLITGFCLIDSIIVLVIDFLFFPWLIQLESSNMPAVKVLKSLHQVGWKNVWICRATSTEIGHQNFHHPLFNPFSKCFASK